VLINPYQERNVFGGSNPRAEAAQRAKKFAMTALQYRADEIENEAAAKAAEYGSDSFGPPGQGRPPAGNWMSSAASGLSSLATNASGLVNQFRGQGAASALPSWGSSLQTSLPPALSAGAAAPSAYQPSGSFSTPWTFPAARG
jgi:hypothetical protein